MWLTYENQGDWGFMVAVARFELATLGLWCPCSAPNLPEKQGFFKRGKQRGKHWMTKLINSRAVFSELWAKKIID